MLQTVTTASTSTSVSSSSNSSVYGQSVTFTATVTAGTFDNSGTVTFFDNGSPLTPAPVLSGTNTATFTTTATQLSGGTHTIKASYSGDTNFATSSDSVLQTVTTASTSTSVSSSSNSSVYGQSVTFTATVTAGTFDNSGTVTFFDNGSALTPAPVLSGTNTATFTTTATQLSGGTHTIKASYSGDTNFATSSDSVLQTVTTASTSTSVSSSSNSSVYGQSVTFTATVTAGTFDNSGTVTFFDNGSALTPAPVLSGTNTATFTTTATQLSGGTHTIKASYSGDTNFATSSDSVLQTVTTASTSTSVSSSSNSSVYGQSVTFTATVTAGTFDNSGTVTFFDNGSPLTPAPVLSGTNTATFTTTATQLSGGTHTIKASYSGDTNFATSSDSVLQTVTTASTSTSVSSSSNSSVYGQSVTFTATVTAGTFDNGGTVTFYDNGSALTPAPVLSGTNTATFTTTATQLSGGTHTIKASYSGDTNFATSSDSVLQTVTTASTSTSVSSSSNSSVYGQSVTFTATVTAGTFDNGGTVTFFDNGSPLTPAPVLSGTNTATFTTTATQLSGGTHTIKASYSGDTNFATSSDSVLQTVTTASTSTSVTSSSNSSVYGQSVTFTATVTAGTFDNSGTVTFYDNGSALTPAPVLSGTNTATFTTTATQLSGGTHTITASYSGDTNFATSSDSVLQTVTTASTSTSVSSSSNSSVYGQSVTFTATVTAGTFDNGGTVTFYDNGSALTPAPVLSGTNTATFTTTATQLSGGTHTIKASYSGDTNFSDQQRQRAANGEHGEHEHVGVVVVQFVGVRPERDVHGDGDGGHVRQQRHGDVLRQRQCVDAGAGAERDEHGDVHDHGDATVGRHAHDQGQLQRRHELCDQQRQRAANGDHGEHDDDGNFLRQSGNVQQHGDVHGDGESAVLRHADRHGDVHGRRQFHRHGHAGRRHS